MFPTRYFPDRMFAARFWPKAGTSDAPFVGPTAFASSGSQRGVDMTSTGTIRGVGVDRSEGKPR